MSDKNPGSKQYFACFHSNYIAADMAMIHFTFGIFCENMTINKFCQLVTLCTVKHKIARKSPSKHTQTQEKSS
jgi:hypothetical protein